MREDFFSAYLQYTSNNESPAIFHRWSAIAAVGAILGRNYRQEFGHQMLATNIYCMLMGTPGTRKSTAIKMSKKLLQAAGYENIAADKTTKEKFLLDLAGHTDDGGTIAPEDFLAGSLNGPDDTDSPREVFIMADEFNDFFGNNIIEFVSLLGSLWDYEGVYTSRVKNGQSVNIPWPTVSLVGGNTPTSFAHVFPPETLGQGFFSRVLLIHGTNTRDKIAFPKPPRPEETLYITNLFKQFQVYCMSDVTRESAAQNLLEEVYHNFAGIQDTRFEYYGQRRFQHLLKLCSIHSAARSIVEKDSRGIITLDDVIAANTVLTAAEHGMPNALGEFGRNKHSDIGNTVLNLLYDSDEPLPFNKLYEPVNRDINYREFQILIQSLQLAGKIHVLGQGFMAIRPQAAKLYMKAIDWNYLTEEERREYGND